MIDRRRLVLQVFLELLLALSIIAVIAIVIIACIEDSHVRAWVLGGITCTSIVLALQGAADGRRLRKLEVAGRDYPLPTSVAIPTDWRRKRWTNRKGHVRYFN